MIFKCNIRGVLFFGSLLLLSTCTALFAQKAKPEHLPSFDQKIYHFGFTLGVNATDFYMDYNPTLNDTLLILEVQKQNGFNLGIVSSLHFNAYWSMRFLPALSFGQRNLEYTFLNPGNSVEKITKPIESTYLEFPLLFKYRSARQNNFAAYMIGGGKYSLDLASKHDVDNSFNRPQEVVILTKRNNWGGEIGFGMDFFLQYFKFSTEIKYAHGFNNIFINDHTKYSHPIESLRSKIILVSIMFEG